MKDNTQIENVGKGLIADCYINRNYICYRREIKGCHTFSINNSLYVCPVYTRVKGVREWNFPVSISVDTYGSLLGVYVIKFWFFSLVFLVSIIFIVQLIAIYPNTTEPSLLGRRIHRLHLSRRGHTPPTHTQQQLSWYDTKQSDCEAPVLEFFFIAIPSRSTLARSGST